MSVWPIVPLQDIATVGAGNSAPQDPKLFAGGDTPFIRTSDVGRIRFGRIDGAEDKLNRDGIKGLRIWPRDTILFPKSGASTFLNHRVIMDVDACVASHLATIVADRSLLLPQFLLHVLHTVRAQDLTQDHNYPSLRLPEIGSIGIPLPPLAEQKRIVAILDEAFEGIAKATANAERNLANARELFAYALDKILAGEGKSRPRRFGDTDMLQIIDGDRGSNYPQKSDFTPNGHCLFLSTKNVRPDGFSFDDVVFISKQKDETLRKGRLRRRDVVLTTRGTIGNIALFDDSVHFEHIRINSGMLVLRPNEETITSEFLFHSLRSAYFRKQMKRTISGAAQPQLPIRSLVAMEIMVPDSLDEQIAASKKIEDLEALCNRSVANYEEKVVGLDDLKQSLLQNAFSGQLTGKEAVAA